MARQKPLELHFVGTGLPAIASVFERHLGFDSWKVFKHADSNLKELFDPESIVYLSPESPNVLEAIDPEAVYVIGGISDNQNELKVIEGVFVCVFVFFLGFFFALSHWCSFRAQRFVTLVQWGSSTRGCRSLKIVLI